MTREAYEDDWIAAHDEEQVLMDGGLLDADQPTRAAHFREQQRRTQATAEFTPEERLRIRYALGIYRPTKAAEERGDG